MKRLARVFTAALLLLAALLSTTAAQAEDEPKIAGKKLQRRKLKLATRERWVVMSAGWRDVVNAKIRKKLLSGLPTVIATRAYVFSEGGDKPLSLSVKTCRVVFDLWDEVFRIDLREGGRRRRTVAVNVEGVLRRCAQSKRMPLIEKDELAPQGRYFVGVLVEVNPLSKKMMERIKRWVSRPKGSGAVSPGDSLFGSFVGLFITQVPDADRALAFRSQTFVVGALPEIVVPKKDDEDRSEVDPDRLPFGMRSVDSGVPLEPLARERVGSIPHEDSGPLFPHRAGRSRSPLRRDWR